MRPSDITAEKLPLWHGLNERIQTLNKFIDELKKVSAVVPPMRKQHNQQSVHLRGSLASVLCNQAITRFDPAHCACGIDPFSALDSAGRNLRSTSKATDKSVRPTRASLITLGRGGGWKNPKVNVKGDGQECPSHTSQPDHPRSWGRLEEP